METKIYDKTPPEKITQLKDHLFNQISQSIRENCKAGFLTRKQVESFTGGAINSRTLANIDSHPEMTGPTNRFNVGKKVCYPVDDFLDWLKTRIEIPQHRISA